MHASDFEMMANERVAARNAEANAFAADRASVRLAGGNFWTHIFGTMPRQRTVERRRSGARKPATSRPAHEGR